MVTFESGTSYERRECLNIYRVAHAYMETIRPRGIRYKYGDYFCKARLESVVESENKMKD